MSFTMQETGPKFLAELIAGSGKKINGMYVEYSTSAKAAGARTHEYFRTIKDQKTAGYGRVAITNAYVDDKMCVHFDALVCPGDMTGTVPAKARLVCATLVHMEDDNPENDTLLWTVDFSSPVHLSKETYTTVHTSMRLGA